MKLNMYLADADRSDRFFITDEQGKLLFVTACKDSGWSRTISDPAQDADMLKVRYSSFAGDSFVFSDVTGTRGTYHVRRCESVIDYHMLNGRWDMRYLRKDGRVTITRRGKPVAEAQLLPEYAVYFAIDLRDPSELLFVLGSLLAVSKDVSTSST